MDWAVVHGSGRHLPPTIDRYKRVGMLTYVLITVVWYAACVWRRRTGPAAAGR